MPVILAFSFNYPTNIYLVLAVGPAKPSALVIMVDNTGQGRVRSQRPGGGRNGKQTRKRFSFPCTLQTRRERDGSQITHIKCEAANGVVRAENTGLCLTEESAEASLTECRWPLAEACGGGSVCGKRISGVVKGVCKALGLWGFGA